MQLLIKLHSFVCTIASTHVRTYMYVCASMHIIFTRCIGFEDCMHINLAIVYYMREALNNNNNNF